MRTSELPREGNVIFAGDVFRRNHLEQMKLGKEAALHEDLLTAAKNKIPDLDTWDGEPKIFVYRPAPKASSYVSCWVKIYSRTDAGIKDIVIEEEIFRDRQFNIKRVALKPDGKLEVFERISSHVEEKHTQLVPITKRDDKDKWLEDFIRTLVYARPQSETGLVKPSKAELRAHFKAPGTEHPRLVV